MQPNLFPFGSVLGNPFIFNGDLSEGGIESSRVFFLLPFFLLSQGGAMDLSKVGEKFLSSVRSARSIGLLPPVPDRPEVPARASAAAAVARALAGLPPHQRYSFSSSSEELSSIYGSRPQGQVVEELEDEFYEEDFDPIKHILEHVPADENELTYFEKQAALRLVQLDKVAEHLSRHVMEHHEVMVKGMNLVRELEKDLRIANVICMNGRRHLTSSMNEVSRDLIVNSYSKKKQALLDMLPTLIELQRALNMQSTLESLVEEGNYWKAFQVLSEYLQLLDSLSELSAIQEMSRGVEVWLGRTLQKLDALLLGVCQEFKEDGYITVIDAYALIGDTAGLAEKIQSFFMQEVISETHSVLKGVMHEDEEEILQNSRLTYSDLCLRIPDSKFRQCLLRTLAVLFDLMCSYHEIMDFELERKDTVQNSNKCNEEISCSPGAQEVDSDVRVSNNSLSSSGDILHGSSSREESATMSSLTETSGSPYSDYHDPIKETGKEDSATLNIESPWYHLRKEAITFVSQTLQRGRRNLWHLTASRVSVLLSSAAVCTASIHQFLKNYEELSVFILTGEAFCGIEAVEFRQKLKAVCENYFTAFHRQNVHALKMVMEKETWLKLPLETVQMISFAGLIGDGAPLISLSSGKSINAGAFHSHKSVNMVHTGARKNGFSHWIKTGNPFLQKLPNSNEGHGYSQPNGLVHGESDGSSTKYFYDDRTPRNNDSNHINGANSVSEDEDEDLLADFIDEDSQLPSRSSKPFHSRTLSSHGNDDENTTQTGSSLCLLKSMDKYARLMQKLEVVNVEFFKGICQLFEIFFYNIYETFGQQNTSSSGKSSTNSLNYRLTTALSRINQDCEEWIKPQSSSPTSLTSSFAHAELTPTNPPNANLGLSSGTSFGLTERCVAVDTISLVARILNRSKAHLQSMLLQSNSTILEDFYVHLVDAVPDLTEHIHRTTVRLLLHINGYVDRVANCKWELKELGMEHNGYVDLLLGEFKHYKTRLAHGGIRIEIQGLLLDYGLEIVAETLVEGLSRVKRCSDEGRALMSLDLQVLINGLQHFVSVNVKPKLQMVETFIKAYYLPETEYVHWARAHPEYTKSQIIGLINLVATMKGWKRKTRLDILEKIE
ncbi:syndetin isoform X1 [Vigna radiata var. radiata]|uniref:Syndetin isoform X1 n=2 Tax=Vigna radiata var. radiata TaxID=3916 RepID=A0A1S3TJA0_VIGRR|nr:syndetin isoform X1 [Vigna radiata var. radiata]XP_022634239.1 syndetin isoform X1 [Vigna radiata var. radiata]XP_022634240.1 syndetin isoform X1 [Vigna radiata var. radiata]